MESELQKVFPEENMTPQRNENYQEAAGQRVKKSIPVNIQHVLRLYDNLLLAKRK